MATKKDFELVARVLRETRESYSPHWDKNLFRACDDHARRMADAFAAVNPNFKRALFLTACGVDPVTVRRDCVKCGGA